LIPAFFYQDLFDCITLFMIGVAVGALIKGNFHA
jgi:hypothetical protein